MSAPCSLRQRLHARDRADAGDRVVVEAGLDALLERGRRVGDVHREQHRLRPLGRDEQRVVPDRVARRLVQPEALRQLDVAGHRREVRALVVPRLVGVAEELERLVVPRLRQLLLVQHVPDARAREELVAADVVDVQVRVDDRRHVAELEPALASCAGIVCSVGLLGQLEREHAVHVVEVDAGVDQEQPVVVLDQDAVDGDPRLRAGHVPHQLRVLDHDRAAVEEPDLHRSASSAFRTATSLPARLARSSSICSGV